MYLGLGSNLGDRHATLLAAMNDLDALPEFVLLRQASWYSTAAMGEAAGEAFINTVVAGHYSGTPEKLLTACQAIEQAHGRTRPYHWAPRTLDIDILWWEGIPWNTPELTIPHPGLSERAFALVPLLEIAPHLADSATGASLSNWLSFQMLNQGIETWAPNTAGAARD